MLKKSFSLPSQNPIPPFPKTFDLIESLFAVFLTQILFRIREVQLWWRAVRQEFRWMTGNSKRHVLFLDLLKKNSRSIVASGVLFKAVFTGNNVDFFPHHEQGFDKVKSLGKVRGGGPWEERGNLSAERFPLSSHGSSPNPHKPCRKQGP